MNHRVYKLVNTYLSEILFNGLKKVESNFTGSDIECWACSNNINIMIDGNYIKLTDKVWYELTNHFGLSTFEVQTVMVGWIRENLHIYRPLFMGDCTYTKRSAVL